MRFFFGTPDNDTCSWRGGSGRTLLWNNFYQNLSLSCTLFLQCSILRIPNYVCFLFSSILSDTLALIIDAPERYTVTKIEYDGATNDVGTFYGSISDRWMITNNNCMNTFTGYITVTCICKNISHHFKFFAFWVKKTAKKWSFLKLQLL